MAGYIDTWGRGIIKIYNSCKEHGLPEPVILEKQGGFMVTLYKAGQHSEDGGQMGGAIGGQMGSQIGGAIEELTDRQKEVLKLIIENPKIGYRTVAEKLSINPSVAQSHFDALREKGFIERIGGTRGYWKVLIEI